MTPLSVFACVYGAIVCAFFCALIEVARFPSRADVAASLALALLWPAFLVWAGFNIWVESREHRRRR